MSNPIPTVDLLAYRAGTPTQQAHLATELVNQLRHGFVYAHHGMSESLIDIAYDMLAEFFTCRTDAKDPYRVPGSRGSSGWTPLGVETAAGATTPDFKEMLNWMIPPPTNHPLRTRWAAQYHDPVFPEHLVPGITDTLQALHHQLAEVQQLFLRVVAHGLGANPSLFDTALEHAPHLTRALHYPSMTLADNDEHIWAGEHADINLVTALPRATSNGLQIRIGDHWVPAAPPDGHAIINTGLMLERVTNGTIAAGWHRVIADGTDERYSVVQFCHPAPDTILAPIAGTVTDTNPQRWLPITAGDMLDRVIYDINLANA